MSADQPAHDHNTPYLDLLQRPRRNRATATRRALYRETWIAPVI